MKVENKKTEQKTEQFDENVRLLKSVRFQHIVDINMVRVFLATWLAVSVLAAIPALRPSYSEVEKRELQAFPKFSFESLVSGEFFDQINLWFSDTFPMRDNFVALNAAITDCFGKTTVQVHGEVSESDEIPDVSSTVNSQEENSQPTDSSSQNDISSDTVSSGEESSQSAPSTSKPQLPAVEQLGAILIANESAYEYYNFNQQTAQNYSAAINRAADILAGQSWVYDMIVPTSMDITLPDDIRANTNSSDQKKAIEYMYSLMSPNVYKVDCFTTLREHRDEYIFFNTDHHWTALGAYYSYREFAAVKGVAPVELSAFTEYRFDGFLGSFYAESGQKPQLANNPDYVLAYEPTQTKFIHTWRDNGTESDLHIVSNANNLSASNKYLTFVCGDHPLGLITNPAITDNSSCVLIKESFGNAMVAYLTQHYQNVWVVDYRYINKVYSGTLNQFVRERGIGEVIFLNNASATRSPALVNAMSAFVGQ